MTVGIFELNDSGIRVGIDAKNLVSSPGVAVIQGEKLLLGEEATQLSRLHPVDTNNLFWHRLSVEPLNKSYAKLRHHADLAYHHLIKLHQQCPDVNEVVFAIPGSFTRDQLSLLLGITQQCPFNAVGLIDSAVAASAAALEQINSGSSNNLVHIEMQLHQCLLTSINTQGHIQRELVNIVPESGLLTMYGKLAQFIADQFVGQSRFDPLHAAATEQQLYNQIPAWLQQSAEHDELILVVGSKTIKLTRAQLVSALTPIYEKILQQAQRLFPDAKHYLLSDRFENFPGFESYFQTRVGKEIVSLNSDTIITNINQNLDSIVSSSGEISFLQSLPLLQSTHASTAAARSQTTPTASPQQHSTTSSPTAASAITTTASHALLQHQAFKIGAEAMYVCGSNRLTINRQKGGDTRCALQMQDGILNLMPLAQGIRVNHHPINDNTVLQTGDIVHFDGVAEPIAIIAEINH